MSEASNLRKLATDRELRAKLEFLEHQLVLLLVDKKVFDAVPEALRSYAARATGELFEALGYPLGAGDPLAFVFTSEDRFFRGSRLLRQSGRLEGREVSCVRSSPSVLLDHLQKIGIEEVIINWGEGQGKGMTVGVADLGRLALIAKLAAFRVFHVVQGRDGYAIPTEIDGGRYALSFLDSDEGLNWISTLSDDKPESHLESNKVGRLARSLLNSEFLGLLIDPGSENEMKLTKDDLRLLLVAADVYRSRHSILASLLRRLVPA